MFTESRRLCQQPDETTIEAAKLIMNETTIREHTCVVTIHSPNLKNNAPSYVFSGLCNESCYSSHVKIYFSFDFDLNAPILKIRSVVITIATSKFRVLPAIAFKKLGVNNVFCYY